MTSFKMAVAILLLLHYAVDTTAKPATMGTGYISVRMKAGILAKNAPTNFPRRVIALLRGSNGFWQRKQMFVGSTTDPNISTLDWYFLDATATYTLYAYWDVNGDGICKETAYSRTIKPVKGVANQVKSYEYSYMNKSTTACAAIDAKGKKDLVMYWRITSSPAVKFTTASDPWYTANDNLTVSYGEPFSCDGDTCILQKYTSYTPAVGSAFTYKMLRPYRFGSVYCDPNKASCRIGASFSLSKDVDTSIPAVAF